MSHTLNFSLILRNTKSEVEQYRDTLQLSIFLVFSYVSAFQDKKKHIIDKKIF